MSSAPFVRTTCDCPECQQCCRDQPGSLAAGDLERIAAHLGQPVHTVLAKFWASPGAVVGDRLTGQTWRVGTITPKLRAGRCVFLDAADRCSIHAVAPFGCAYFDTHMSAEEAQPRSRWLIGTQTTADYQSLRKTLAPATSYKPKAY